MRFGNYVYVSLHMIGSASSGGSGYLQVSGLPLPPWDADPDYRGSGAVTYASGFSTTPVGIGASGTSDDLYLQTPDQNGSGLAWSAVAGRSFNLQASVLYRFR